MLKLLVAFTFLMGVSFSAFATVTPANSISNNGTSVMTVEKKRKKKKKKGASKIHSIFPEEVVE